MPSAPPGDDALVVTLANSGYVPAAHNWFESLRRVGLAERALVFATSARAERALAARGVPCRRLSSRHLAACPDLRTDFRTAGWREIVLRKLEVVHRLLRQGRSVLFADADVVFLRDPLAYLAAATAAGGLSIQQDRHSRSRPNAKPDWRLCTGFFFVRPSAATLHLFDLRRDDVTDFDNDQPLLNRRIARDAVRHRKLPIELFPNGRVWYRSHRELVDAFVVHFNWVVGDKLRWMERYGLRLVEDEAGVSPGSTL